MGLEDMAFAAGARAYGLKLRDGTITHRTGSGPIAGATARVETSGDIERRITVTRLLAVGVFALALRKKADHRVMFLTIDGAGYQILVELPAKRETDARKWVTQFNNRARIGEATEQVS